MEEINKEEKYSVYVHISPNNKAYIGITKKNVQERWGNGGINYKRNKHFWSAINEYGWDNFEHIILFENLTKEKACKIEVLLIALFNTQNPEFGYNISPGGDLGWLGCTLSDTTRQKISEANKGVLVGENNPMYGISPKERMDPDTYSQWKEKLINFTTSDEFRQQCRERNIGKKYSDDVNKKKGRKGEQHPMYGKHHSEETKNKISVANTGRKYSDEINAKKGKKGANNPSAKSICQYDKNGVLIHKWDYAKLAAETLHIDLSSIIACCRGTNGRKTAGGFIWKYAVDEKEGFLCVS